MLVEIVVEQFNNSILEGGRSDWVSTVCVFNAWPGNFASLSMHELDRLKLVLFEGQMALPQPNFVL